MSEWTKWAKQFEAGTKEEFTGGKLLKTETPARCLYPMIEGPHKVACLDVATGRSSDNYPTCPEHAGEPVRPGWKGFVKGA